MKHNQPVLAPHNYSMLQLPDSLPNANTVVHMVIGLIADDHEADSPPPSQGFLARVAHRDGNNRLGKVRDLVDAGKFVGGLVVGPEVEGQPPTTVWLDVQKRVVKLSIFGPDGPTEVGFDRNMRGDLKAREFKLTPRPGETADTLEGYAELAFGGLVSVIEGGTRRVSITTPLQLPSARQINAAPAQAALAAAWPTAPVGLPVPALR